MRRRLQMGIRLTLLMAAAASTDVARLSAQQWHVSAQGGRVRSLLDPAAATSTFSLGIHYSAPSTSFGITTGVPVSTVDALWAGAALSTRAAVRRSGLVAGVDLGANGFITRDRSTQPAETPPLLPTPFDPPLSHVADRSGHALAGQVLPLLGFESSRFQLHARAGVSAYAARFGDMEANRTVRMADVQLTMLPAGSFIITPVVRHFMPQNEPAASYAGVSAVAGAARAAIRGSLGKWLEPESADIAWSAGLSLNVHERATIEAAARRDAFDPLFLQPAQTSWSVGISVLVGGHMRPAAPVPASYVDGRALIRLPVKHSASAPSIAGDFTDWLPVAMLRDGDHWTISVALEPGVYSYSFVAADGTWFVPEDTPGRRDDGMGGHVAVLVVS